MFLVVASLSFAADCASLRAAQKQTYGFSPRLLTEEQRNKKSDEMDKFWQMAKADPSSASSCLEQLLREQRSDGFFQFDGAMLLREVGKEDHLSSVREAVENASLADVQPASYIRMALDLSRHGQDISRIATNYLEAADVTTYLPEHGAYRLGREEGSILLFGGLPADEVDRLLVPELNSQTGYVRNTAAQILSVNMTEASFKALARLGTMRTFSENARKSVNSVLTRKKVKLLGPAKYTREAMLAKLKKLPDMDPQDSDPEENRALDNSLLATLTPQDLPALQEARRRMIEGVSNESVEGYLEMSRLLLGLINHLDLYKQYRHS